MTEDAGLQEQIDLEADAEFIQAEVARRVAPQDAVTAAIRMHGLKMRIDELEAEAKVLQEQYDALRKKELVDLMHAAGIAKDGRGNFTVPGVGRIQLGNKMRAGVRADDRESFFEWLRENGAGDLIKETVHPQTLDAWAREMVQDGKRMPEMVSVFTETVASIVKTK